MNEMETALAHYIVTEVLRRPKYSLGADEALLSNGLIDSFHRVDLALFVESQYGVRLDDSELTPETFDTVRQLAALIEMRRG
jgi:acyl carrier protein